MAATLEAVVVVVVGWLLNVPATCNVCLRDGPAEVEAEGQTCYLTQ